MLTESICVFNFRTSYGRMNCWHDYKVPLSLGERPRLSHRNKMDPLGPGVEISVPNPRDGLLEPSEVEKRKLRQLVAEKNKLEIAASTSCSSGDLSKYLKRKKKLSPIYSGEEPLVVGGRILRPDPVSDIISFIY